ncbi:hypothetical protein KAM447_24640 [Aeromonas caviae]|uniref:O-antigen polysaccharide polymerase Wzy n=1 Tax=Aeromonas caviae TaxID=648 RepID=UPI001FC8D4D1|nr:O-antigen polysaccharide polymerase Wzy [Aeromonas caviae]GKQ75956.1 hypothetical protein KAM447_24640 [Aeromonas caviae]
MNSQPSYFRHLLFYQLIVYILVLPIFLISYLISYVDILWAMPYIFVAVLIFILVGNYYSGLYLNSTYSLFIIAFSLFIGGRFFAYLFNDRLNLYEMDFFAYYNLKPIDALNLMTYLVTGIISLDLGYKVARISNKAFPDIGINHQWMRKLSIFSLFLAPLFMIETVLQVRDAISGGYLSSKLWQTQSYSFPLSSLAQTIFGICFGYSMVFGFKRTIFIVIFIFGVIGSLLVGARGPIMTALLLYIWIKGSNGQKRVSLFKVFSIGLIVMVSVSYFIQMYSFRSNEEDFESDIFMFLADFLYDQGISVMVFDVSMKVTDYPILAYFQSFIPGSSALASLMFPVEYYMTGFQHYMARELDPDLFSLGFGLDWTLFSDFYVFGGENILGFSIIGFLFGYSLSVLQNSSKLDFWIILLFSLFTRIMFLPRSSVSVIFPFICYFFIFVFLFPRLRFSR